ncbi:MAG: YcnI family protein, partial [Mycobacterium sp.]|nr:YcnI family protein [Mycobacterium sp.]
MSWHRRPGRHVLSAAVATIALCLGSTVGIAPASAHVRASSDDAVRGDTALVTFEAPNESGTGAATTGLAVRLPDLTSVQAEMQPGWTVKVDRDSASGKVRSVTWTAAPDGGIGVDQFGLFRISVKLPDADTVSFPATQTYADGVAVKWDQPLVPGAAEPEHPAPTLTLAARSRAPAAQHEGPEATAA